MQNAVRLYFRQVRLVRKPCHANRGLHLQSSFLPTFEYLHCFRRRFVHEQGFSAILFLRNNSSKTQNWAYLGWSHFRCCCTTFSWKRPFQNSVKEPSTAGNECTQKCKNWHVKLKSSQVIQTCQNLLKSFFWMQTSGQTLIDQSQTLCRWSKPTVGTIYLRHPD